MTKPQEESSDTLVYQKALECARNRNFSEYLELIMILAEKGHASAQMCLGSSYLYGIDGLLESDFNASLKWHLKALHAKEPENFYFLSILYDPKVHKNLNIPFKNQFQSDMYLLLAIKGFEEKAESGDLDAMYKLAEVLSSQGVGYDKEKSTYWMNKWKKYSAID
jgi:TPR repeat protein